MSTSDSDLGSMTRGTDYSVVGLALLLALGACSPSVSGTANGGDGDGDGDTDGDAGGDVDGDADGDIDGDGDGDGDSDGDGDGDGDADQEENADTGGTLKQGTCETCAADEECTIGSFCLNLASGGMACLPGCNPDIPTCPRAFSCSIDMSSGISVTACLPVGERCCVDQDADEYGQGVGCLGVDCDDSDPFRSPGTPEICNEFDENCDDIPDNAPPEKLCEPVDFATNYICSEGACVRRTSAAPNDCDDAEYTVVVSR